MMSTGLIVPIKVIPEFEPLLGDMRSSLSEFFEAAGKITVGVNLSGGIDLLNSILVVQDFEKNLFCWVTFSELAKELREEPESDLPFMAHVVTRGEGGYLFSIAVAYALGVNFGGRVIYDDSHRYLDGKKDAYTLLDVRGYIFEKINTPP